MIAVHRWFFCCCDKMVCCCCTSTVGTRYPILLPPREITELFFANLGGGVSSCLVTSGWFMSPLFAVSAFCPLHPTPMDDCNWTRRAGTFVHFLHNSVCISSAINCLFRCYHVAVIIIFPFLFLKLTNSSKRGQHINKHHNKT